MNTGWCIVELSTGDCWTCPGATEQECRSTAWMWCQGGIKCAAFPYVIEEKNNDPPK